MAESLKDQIGDEGDIETETKRLENIERSGRIIPTLPTHLGQIVRHGRLDLQHGIDRTAKRIDLLMFIAHENLRHTLIVDNVSDRFTTIRL